MKACILDFASLSPQDLSLQKLWSLPIEWSLFDTTQRKDLDSRLLYQEIVLTNKVEIDAAMLFKHRSIKLIVVLATGTNNIDLKAARENNIRVCNIVDYSTESVVQHTFSLILALQTRLLEYHQSVKQGDWSRSPFFCLLDHQIQNIYGKIFGIIGLGNIGKRVKQIAEAFGADVLVAESLVNEVKHDSTRVTLDYLLTHSDIITVHAPLSDETHHLIDASAFEKMKSSAIFINVSRGGIVDEEALLKALKNRQIRAAGLDVLGCEPPEKAHPLLCLDYPGLLVTPHVAWGSQQSRQSLVDQVFDVLMGYKKNDLPSCIV